jgi:hypothetical protein
VPQIPLDELRRELEEIRLAILSLEQFTVPRVEESEARRKIDDLLVLLDVNF